MMWIILTAIFGTTTVLFAYTTYNLYSKVVFYQEWYDNLATTIEEMYNQLKRLDNNQAFESDDEVGMFFDSLREMMKELFRLGFYDTEKIDQDFE